MRTGCEIEIYFAQYLKNGFEFPLSFSLPKFIISSLLFKVMFSGPSQPKDTMLILKRFFIHCLFFTASWCRSHKGSISFHICQRINEAHWPHYTLGCSPLEGTRSSRERPGLPMIALFSTEQNFPLIISPFSNFSCCSPGQITSTHSPAFHQYSVIFPHSGITVW